MKASHIAVPLGVIGIASIMNWIRGGADFNIVTALPFLGGRPPGIFDVGSLCLIGITVWGIQRLMRRDGEE